MNLKRKEADKILDRIDIQVEILPVPFKDLSERTGGESSAEIRRRVVVARTIADHEGSPDVLPTHIREATGYRNLDRGSWGHPLLITVNTLKTIFIKNGQRNLY